MLKRLTLTPALRAAIDSVQRAEAAYQPGRMSAAGVEIAKLGLADELLIAVAAQSADARLLLDQLPKARAAVVDLERRRRGRRRRA